MTGNGISSITKTGTSGLVDTYTITFTDGTTTTFEVTNGEDGEVTQAQFDDLEQRVEDAEKNQLTNTPTPATSHYLQDSADSRFRKFIPIGRTTQESTTGKNLFDKNTIANGAIYRSNGNIDSDTLSTHQHSDYIEIEESTQYYVTIKTFPSSNYGFAFYDNSKAFISSIASANLITTPATAKYVRICWSISGTYANDINTTQLEKGSTATDYEPYTGGEPGPNPNYEMPIKNTGDNGSVNEKVQNKNLVKTQFEQYLAIDGSGQHRTVVVAAYKKGQIVKVKPNTIYSVNGNYTSLGDNTLRIGMFDEYPTIGSITTKFSTTNNSSISFTTDINTKYLLFYNNLTVNTVLDNFILVEGNYTTETMPTYVPHSEQNISFPLAEGQKLMEGDYPDDDEKVHHKMKEITLDGVTDGLKFTGNEATRNNRFWLRLSDIKQQAYTENTYIKSSHFLYNISVYRDTMDDVAFCVNNQHLFVRFGSGSEIDTITKANNWLAEHLPKFQYELAEEQTEDFTEEQKTAWEQIKKARTYKNITHISSEDETPANVEITYVRDLETVINNLSN